MHIDGEVISTAKLLPPSHAVGNLASAHLTERKSEPVKVEVAPMDDAAAAPPQPIQSAEWSEESGSEDDVILESIISLGMPSSRQAAQASKPKVGSSSSQAGPTKAYHRPSMPKSASAHSLGHSQQYVQQTRPAIPPSQSADSSLAKATTPLRDSPSDDDDDDDDEMLYACIRSAKPTAKPVPPPRTSSISGKSSSSSSTTTVHPTTSQGSFNGAQRPRPSRPPMELPKPPAPKEVTLSSIYSSHYVLFNNL